MTRGRLRLAWASGSLPVRESRALLLARTLLVWVGALVMTFVAWVLALSALAPVLWRRAPLGSRRRPPRHQARVIPLPLRQQGAGQR